MIKLLGFTLIFVVVLTAFCAPETTTQNVTTVTGTTITTTVMMPTTSTTLTATVSTVTTQTTTLTSITTLTSTTTLPNFLISGPKNDRAIVILSTLDGGFLIGGTNNSTEDLFLNQGNHGLFDAFLIKLDAMGDLDTSFGGDGIMLYGGNDSDSLYDAFQTSDGGYVFVGGTKSTTGDLMGEGWHGGYGDDILVVKVLADGSLDSSFAGNGVLVIGGGPTEWANSVVQTTDGGYILTGTTRSNDGHFAAQGYQGNYDMFVIKLTASGAFDTSFATDGILEFGGSSLEECTSIIQTADSGYLAVGFSVSSNGLLTGQGVHGNRDLIAIKYNNNGTLDASFAGDGIVAIGGAGLDEPHDVIQTSDGGYLITGFSTSSDGDLIGEIAHGGNDLWVVKLTAGGSLDTSFSGNGTLLIGGTGADNGISGIETSDNGYLLIGDTSSNSGDFVSQGGYGLADVAIIKLLSNGSFDNSFSGDGIFIFGGSGADLGKSIVESMTGNYIFTGTSQSANGYLSGSTYVSPGEDILFVNIFPNGTF